MNKEPVFSIIIPVFNAEKYIEKCIRSIIEQSYDKIQLIVIDGGSSDSTVDIIEKYSSHISYFVSEKDKGQSYAINKGFLKATGDIISWINADERYAPDTLLKVKEKMQNSAVDICYGNTLMTNERESITFIKKQPPILPFLYMLTHGEVLASDATFWRRSLREKVGLLNEEKYPRISMDYDWFLRLTFAARKCCYLNAVLSERIDLQTASTNSATYLNIKSNRNNIIRSFLREHRIPSFFSKILFVLIAIFQRINPSIIKRRKQLSLLQAIND
jgi:glycosyltransferase involved in cell wall biosynthesis